MSRDLPIEALLRPPVEYYAAAGWFLVMIIAVAAPSVIMLTPSVSIAAAIGCAALGLMRAYQAHQIVRYQRGLTRLPFYKLSSNSLPVSKSRLFIGRGFEWDQRHTQRLADFNRAENRRYRSRGVVFDAVRRLEPILEDLPVLNLISRFTQSTRFSDNPLESFMARFNPVEPLPEVGGQPAIHGVGLREREQDLYIKSADRGGHTLVLGTTGVGKTRLAELLITQDIRRGDVVIVFDPKGDADLFRRMYAEAKAANREDHFYCFHLGFPDISARYNPVANFDRVTEVATRIANQLPGEGQSAAFRDFVWRYVNVIAKALTALGRKVDYTGIKYYGENIEPLVIDYLEFVLENNNVANWREKVAQYERHYADPENKEFRKPRQMVDRSDKAMALLTLFREQTIVDYPAFSLIKTFEYDRNHFDKLVGSLLPLMEKLCTGKCAELISPDYLDISDTRPIFTWTDVIRAGGIVYVGLDALADAEVAAAVGNAMLADLTSIAGRLYKHGPDDGLPGADSKRTINVHADEFNELIGDEFIPLLNKARGAGFQVTAYTQTWSDVIARLQDKAKAGQVAGNFNTILMLRVEETETAEMLTKKLRQVEINHLMVESGTTDSSDPGTSTHFVSNTRQRIATQQVDAIHVQDLTTLPKGQAFGLLNGGKPYKLRLPLPDTSDFDGVPPKLEQIADQMAASYVSSTDWHQYTPSWQETT